MASKKAIGLVEDYLRAWKNQDRDFGAAVKAQSELLDYITGLEVALGRLSSPSWQCDVASVLRMESDEVIEAASEQVVAMSAIASEAITGATKRGGG